MRPTTFFYLILLFLGLFSPHLKAQKDPVESLIDSFQTLNHSKTHAFKFTMLAPLIGYTTLSYEQLKSPRRSN